MIPFAFIITKGLTYNPGPLTVEIRRVKPIENRRGNKLSICSAVLCVKKDF